MQTSVYSAQKPLKVKYKEAPGSLTMPRRRAKSPQIRFILKSNRWMAAAYPSQLASMPR